MRRFALLAALVIFTVPLAGQFSAPEGIVKLQDLKHRARPLLIFAAQPNDPELQIQLRALNEHAAAAADRQIVPIAIPFDNPSPTAAQLTPAEAVAARQRFHVPPDQFTVILIGKDGGEKLRAHKPLTMNRLEATIDAMPMRQDEMRQAAAQGSGPGSRP